MEIEDRIKEEIEKIKPYLYSDGGDIEFIKYEDKIVFVKLTGACAHCAYQDNTIKDGILSYLQEKIPEIENIITVDF